MSTSVNNFKAYTAETLNSAEAVTTLALDRITNILGETLTTSDFVDMGRGIITVAPDSDGTTQSPEYISFTGISGTSLTGCTRGLSGKGNTSSTSRMNYYPVGTPVVISFGVHNFEDLKDYVDDSVAAVSVGTATVVLGTAGETITAGQLVYLKNDGKWWLTDADTASTVDGVQLGIAQGAGSTDGAITNGVMLRGLDTNQSGLVAGTTYYASNTAGAIASSAGTTSRAIGVARSSTTIYFDPVFISHPTAKEKSFISAGKLNVGSTIYAADSVGTDSYAITVSPAPGTLAAGMVFNFKAGTANTGACTLAINGGSAITLKKSVSSDLATGDILQNQIVTVIYDGTNFQVLSKLSLGLSLASSGDTTRDISAADGAQTIAHGLGLTPKLVRIKIVNSSQNSGAANFRLSMVNAVYTSSQSADHVYIRAGDGATGNAVNSGALLRVFSNADSFDTNVYAAGTITVDSTNITITWAKAGSPTGTANITWEAIA